MVPKATSLLAVMLMSHSDEVPRLLTATVQCSLVHVP